MKTIILSFLIFFFKGTVIAQKAKVLVWDASRPTQNSLYWEMSEDEAKGKKDAELIDSKLKIYWLKTEKLRINTNEFLQVKIINANPLKYKYSIDGMAIDFFEGRKEEFTSTIDKIDGVDNNNGQDDSGVGGADGTKVGSSGIKKNSMKLIPEIQSTNNFVANESRQLLNDSSAVEVINKLIQHFNEDIEKVNKELAGLEKELKRKNTLIAQKDKQIAELKKEKDSLLKELANKIKFREAITIVKEQIKKIDNLRVEVEGQLTELKNEDFYNKNTIQDNRLRWNKEYNTINSKTKEKLIDFDIELKKEDAEKINTVIENHYNPIKKVVEKELGTLMNLKFYYYSEQIAVDGENIDVFNLVISRMLRNDENAKPKNFPYDIWITGGFKIDVSAGFFISGLNNHEYIFPTGEFQTEEGAGMEDSDENQGNAIVRSNTGRWEYGFGTMLNISHRLGTWTRPTLSVGAMLTNDTKFQFLLGGGAILGKKERVIFHAGWALGKVTRLENGLVADGETQFEIDQESMIPTEEEFNSSFFFGITYNLGKVKSANN